MKKTFLKTAVITMAGVCVLAGSALAVPITGGLSMTGGFTPVGTPPPTISDAVSIDFGSATLGGTDNTFGLQSKTGSFVSLANTSLGTIVNLTFDPQALPTSPFWTIEGFSFNMTSYTVSKYVVNGSNRIDIYGVGTLHDATAGSVYDDTIGYWNFTGQGVDDENFSWSASVGASIAVSPVPEPATMLLFGSGLIGLAFVGRKFRK